MASYRLNEEADDDLGRLFDYGIENFGLASARAYVKGMIQRFEELAINPLLYQAIDHICEGYRRSVYRSHSIYYMVNNETIDIMRILKRENPAEQLLRY